MTTMVLTSQIRPHPANVREHVGDVTELAASIKQLGLLQQPNGGA